MGTGVLGGMIKGYINALIDKDKKDQTKLTVALGDAIEDFFSGGTPGAIQMYGGAIAPSGWLLCDGSSLARTGTYASLFAIIGTTFGAVDASHFNLPDFRGIFPRGAGTNDTLSDAAGNDFAATLGAYQNDAMQKITGEVGKFRTTGNTSINIGALSSINQGDDNAGDGDDGNTYSITLDSSNSITPNPARTDDSETRPANLGITFIIRY